MRSLKSAVHAYKFFITNNYRARGSRGLTFKDILNRRTLLFSSRNGCEFETLANVLGKCKTNRHHRVREEIPEKLKLRERFVKWEDYVRTTDNDSRFKITIAILRKCFYSGFNNQMRLRSRLVINEINMETRSKSKSTTQNNDHLLLEKDMATFRRYIGFSF